MWLNYLDVIYFLSKAGNIRNYIVHVLIEIYRDCVIGFDMFQIQLIFISQFPGSLGFITIYPN